MGVIIVFYLLIPILLISIIPAAIVFHKLKRKGKDPALWTILTFLISAAILIVGLILIINTIPFKR